MIVGAKNTMQRNILNMLAMTFFVLMAFQITELADWATETLTTFSETHVSLQYELKVEGVHEADATASHENGVDEDYTLRITGALGSENRLAASYLATRSDDAQDGLDRMDPPDRDLPPPSSRRARGTSDRDGDRAPTPTHAKGQSNCQASVWTLPMRTLRLNRILEHLDLGGAVGTLMRVPLFG